MLDRVLETVESCNLNFLLGSGLSSPYLRTLGLIESLLTDLEKKELPEATKKLLRCSLYVAYFNGVISKNRRILEGDIEAKFVTDGYFEFLKNISKILLRRKSTILGKEVNLFTTNIDIFLERSIEAVGIECNDGFSGRFAPRFAPSNFRKTHHKRSLQYDNVSELPTVNLLKLHGSLTWRIGEDDQIFFSPDLNHVRTLQEKSVTPALLMEISYLDKISFEYLPILPTGTCIFAGLLANVPVVMDIEAIEPRYEPKNKTRTLTDKWE